MSVVDFNSAGSVNVRIQPKTYNVSVYRGNTLTFYLGMKNGTTPIDITSWTVTVATEVVGGGTVPTGVVTATIPNPADGRVVVRVDASIPEIPANAETQYKYAVTVNDGTDKRTFVAGTVTVTDDVG